MIAPNVNKNNDRGFQSNLARRMGVSRQWVNAVFTGRSVPGRKMSKKLEELTGVSRIVWMFPEIHENPLIKKNGDVQQS